MKRISAIHILIVIMLSCMGFVYCSHVNIPIQPHEPISESSDKNSSDDSICDMALTTFYPEPYRQESFALRPYLKRVLEQDSQLRIQIPRELSREFVEHPHSPMQDLLIKAAHQALKDKIAELEQKNLELKLKEEKLQRRLSKKQTVTISTISGLATSLITLLVTLLTK